MPRRKSIIEGGSNVHLDNLERGLGNRNKRYRQPNGKYDKDSNHEIDLF